MSRSEFKVELVKDSGENIVFISGAIDASADFGIIEVKAEGTLHINLNGVTAINSCGIREWILWVKKETEDRPIVLHKCPKVVVDQINMVVGFLPKNGRVDSFYVPYSCESIGTEKMVLFTRGIEYKGNQVFPPDNIKCDETSKKMEVDILEAKYFLFIRSSAIE